MEIILVTIILGVLPSFGWLLFFLKEDYKHPEPRRMIFYAFLAGAASTFFALAFQIIFQNWAFFFGVGIYSPLALVFLAAIEEVVKFGAVYYAISRRKEFDEPLDAMVYMITAALGFAAVENVASALQSPNGLETTALRFIGATLLHSLSSALVGYYWGKAMLAKTDFKKLIGQGLLWAVLIHVFFNYLILLNGPVGLGIVLLVFVAFFVLNDFEHLKKFD